MYLLRCSNAGEDNFKREEPKVAEPEVKYYMLFLFLQVSF